MPVYGRKLGKNPHFRSKPYNRMLSTIPQSFSLFQNAGNVFNQGAYGTCVANAVAGVQELAYGQRRDGAGGIRVSRAAIYSQAKFSYEPTDIADDGLKITDGLLIPKNYGWVHESDFPYPDDPTGKNTGNLLEPVPPDEWTESFDEVSYLAVDFSNVDDMMAAIVEHDAPLVVGLLYPLGWESLPQTGYCDPAAAGEPAGGHCIYIGGFDQTLYGGAFELRQSWGEFGAKGNIWIPFSAQKVVPQYWFDESYLGVFP